MQMELLGHTFFVYIDMDTNLTHVLYLQGRQPGAAGAEANPLHRLAVTDTAPGTPGALNVPAYLSAERRE